MDIRRAIETDLPEIQAIYAHHVLNGTGTFEEDPPSLEDLAARFAATPGRGGAGRTAPDGTGGRGYAD